MAGDPEGTNSDPSPAPSPPRPRRRWWFAGLAVGLLIAETAAKSHSGLPFAVSLLDALVLVALAIVIGTYVILARAEREQPSSVAGERGPTADEPRK